jgi:hypothetical protein
MVIADTCSGLLPLLKSIHRPTQLKQHAGETLAVDAYGWLHRGAIACAIELAEGKPSQKCVLSGAIRKLMMLIFIPGIYRSAYVASR